MDKTKEELQNELDLGEKLENERKLSDQKYAVKLVEFLVFGAIKVILLAVLAAIIGLVIIRVIPTVQ